MSMREISNGLSSMVREAGASIVRVEGGRRRPASGVVWDARHVITTARAAGAEHVTVGAGERSVRAKVRGRDPGTDLALLELEGENALATLGARPVLRGDATAIAVGQLAVRLARPGRTVQASLGIISALGEEPYTTEGGGEVDRYLASDAEHRPGFSGGALVSVDGALLGLTSTALVRGRSVSIPVVTLERVVGQFLAHGHVRESYLGLVLRPTRLPRNVIDATGEAVGLLVLDVDSAGPSAASGLRFGDTVLHLGDDSVRTVDDVWRYLRADRAGQTIPIKVWRDSRIETLSVTLAPRPN